MIALFPYRAQIKLHKWPVATIAVCVICLVIFWFQARGHERIEAHAKQVCAEFAKGTDGGSATQSYRFGRRTATCEQVLVHIHFDSDRPEHLAWHVDALRKNGQEADAERLEVQYAAFAAHAPFLLTDKLWHDRSHFNPLRMITSSFAHGDWEHVIFNVIFFFAFAAAVELVLGPVLFLGSIVVLSLAIGTFDVLMVHWQSDPGPSLGLSGVVMGMLALFVYFLPRVKIRFAFWFVLVVGTVAIPAWLVATWYVGWDFYYQMNRPFYSNTNYVAHLAGAAFGGLLGVMAFSAKRHWARDIIEDTVDLTEDEGWRTKLNAIATSMAVLPILFFALLFVLWLAISFVQSFGMKLLLISPPLAALYYLYRTRRGPKPIHEIYRAGAAALDDHRFEEAFRILGPLAEKNYPRALETLARLHATGQGAVRDEVKAAEYYRRAAERGSSTAQYALATLYADGRGVARDPQQAIAWYRKAAEQSMPEAASSLAYIYENGSGVPADIEQAIEWYYRAGVAYRKAGRRDDAIAVITHLEGLAVKYPAVLGAISRLRLLAEVPGSIRSKPPLGGV
jgi:membrane associated rhomboid family serine protease